MSLCTTSKVVYDAVVQEVRLCPFFGYFFSDIGSLVREPHVMLLPASSARHMGGCRCGRTLSRDSACLDCENLIKTVLRATACGRGLDEGSQRSFGSSPCPNVSDQPRLNHPLIPCAIGCRKCLTNCFLWCESMAAIWNWSTWMPLAWFRFACAALVSDVHPAGRPFPWA